MAVYGYDDLSAYGWGFKELFGTEVNKEFLVVFLTEIFPDNREVRQGT